ncbi:hypothetical protein [Methanooceanicella nereidis]|nr:hypothetical protein [Methanocella sp. CWC-04]
MRKNVSFILMILLMSAMLAGCTGPGTDNGATVTPDAATPTPAPTQNPVPTPTPAPTLTPYDTDKPQKQYLSNGVLLSHPKTWRGEDWMMPVAMPGENPAHHGVVQELVFENPTDSNKTVSSWNLKSMFNYKLDYKTYFLISYDIFYDEKKGFYSDLRLAPGEQKRVFMYSYIVGDREYDKYSGFINEQVNISPNPA